MCTTLGCLLAPRLGVSSLGYFPKQQNCHPILRKLARLNSLEFFIGEEEEKQRWSAFWSLSGQRPKDTETHSVCKSSVQTETKVDKKISEFN